MKVVIQNDCKPLLTRQEIEAMRSFFPERWGRGVKTILFCKGSGSEIAFSYFKKGMILTCVEPKETRVGGYGNEEKVMVLRDLLAVLECIAELGDFPKNPKKSLYDECLQKTAAVLAQCVPLLQGYGAS